MWVTVCIGENFEKLGNDVFFNDEKVEQTADIDSDVEDQVADWDERVESPLDNRKYDVVNVDFIWIEVQICQDQG